MFGLRMLAVKKSMKRRAARSPAAATKPTFETDDMILLHRAPDRDRRRQGFRHGCRRICAEAAEHTVYRSNQARKLIGSDAVFSDIAADDHRHQAGIDLLRGTLVGHIFVQTQRLIGFNVVKTNLFSNFVTAENIWLRQGYNLAISTIRRAAGAA